MAPLWGGTRIINCFVSSGIDDLLFVKWWLDLETLCFSSNQEKNFSILDEREKWAKLVLPTLTKVPSEGADNNLEWEAEFGLLIKFLVYQSS